MDKKIVELKLTAEEMMLLYLALGETYFYSKELTFGNDFDSISPDLQLFMLEKLSQMEGLYTRMHDYLISLGIPKEIIDRFYQNDLNIKKPKPGV